MDRRNFLKGSAGMAIAGMAAGASQAFAGGSAGASVMSALCDKSYDAFLKLSPLLCTTFGVDKGAYAAQKSRIEGDTPDDRAAYARLLAEAIGGLAGIDRTKLHGMDRVNADTLDWQWRALLAGVKDFPYGVKGPTQPQSPYVLSHLTGMAQALPDFFDSNHQIDTSDDAEAYLARMERFGPVLDSETGHAVEDIAAGARPPAFVLKRAVTNLQRWQAQDGDDNLLIASVTRRTAEKAIKGDWNARAKGLWAGTIRPALARQIALLEAELPKAGDEAGVWRLPQGDA